MPISAYNVRKPPEFPRHMGNRVEEHNGDVRFQTREVEIRQLRTCTLKNDTVVHNGFSYGAHTTFHITYF